MFTYAGPDLQISWSEGRAALGEHVRGESRWHFMGWLYEGEVTDFTKAQEFTREWLALIGEKV